MEGRPVHWKGEKLQEGKAKECDDILIETATLADAPAPLVLIVELCRTIQFQMVL